MNETMVRTLLQVKRAIKDKVLTDVGRVEAFFKDMLKGKYDGERTLLLLLMREGVPRRAREGRYDSDAALNAEARHIAKIHHMEEDWVRRGLLVWRYVAQADAETAAAGRLDAKLLRELAKPAPAPAPKPPPPKPPPPPRPTPTPTPPRPIPTPISTPPPKRRRGSLLVRFWDFLPDWFPKYWDLSDLYYALATFVCGCMLGCGVSLVFFAPYWWITHWLGLENFWIRLFIITFAMWCIMVWFLNETQDDTASGGTWFLFIIVTSITGIAAYDFVDSMFSGTTIPLFAKLYLYELAAMVSLNEINRLLACLLVHGFFWTCLGMPMVLIFKPEIK